MHVLSRLAEGVNKNDMKITRLIILAALLVHCVLMLWISHERHESRLRVIQNIKELDRLHAEWSKRQEPAI